MLGAVRLVVHLHGAPVLQRVQLLLDSTCSSPGKRVDTARHLRVLVVELEGLRNASHSGCDSRRDGDRGASHKKSTLDGTLPPRRQGGG